MSKARWRPMSCWLLALLAGAGIARSSSAAETACPPDGGELRTVVRLAGDGLLALDDGSEARAIGLVVPLPPEGSDAALWPPAAALKDFLERSLMGKTVRLAVEGRERDRHEVRLAHVVYPAGDHETWLAGEIVSRGLARVDPGMGQGICAARLLELERAARSAGNGLWQLPHYRIRDANDTTAMKAEALHFTIAEGIVRDVGRRSGGTYLNFGPRRRTDFAALILERDRRALETAGLRAEDLIGRRVRLRGWIELREGPIIRISHGRQIELLEPVVPRQTPPAAKRKRPAREAPDVETRQ